MHKFATRCVHAGTIKNEAAGGINSPVYTSTSFEYIDKDETIYPRYLNVPNEKAVAEKIASLENTGNALVFSSGMAAISTVLLTFLGQGDHVVFQKGLYGGTSHFIQADFARFGIDYSIAASQKAGDLREALRENTRIIFIETPSNPLLSITDMEAVAGLGKEKEILTVIDNTFATPVNQQPALQGIDIMIHSATKYMGGHSDIQAGAVAAGEELIAQIYETGLNLGGSLNAQDLYLLERSLKTLHLRVDKINSNAMEIAHFLDTHEAVDKVYYPGLPSHPGHQLASRQMKGYGGMLSFEPTESDGVEFQRKLKLIKPSMSLGGTESICCSPALTSHRHLGVEGRKAEGIPENLVRLSIGIEDAGDLMDDLTQALS